MFSNAIHLYQNNTPTLILEEHLQGHLSGHGVIQDWRGRVVKCFEFKAEVSWKNGVGIIDETMHYNDNTTDKRVWQVQKQSENIYTAATQDLTGEAKIHVAGNAMQWQYQMNVTVGNRTVKLTFDDWMYLMSNETILNLNTFKKFGLKVGSLTLALHKDKS